MQPRPGGSQSGPCGDNGGLCPPATYTHTPGPAPRSPWSRASSSRAGGRVWERAGAAEPELQPGPGDAASPGRRRARQGLCATSWAKPCPGEHSTAPQLWGHPVSPRRAWTPCVPRLDTAPVLRELCALLFPLLWRRDAHHGTSLVCGHRADLAGSELPEMRQRRLI